MFLLIKAYLRLIINLGNVRKVFYDWFISPFKLKAIILVPTHVLRTTLENTTITTFIYENFND